MEHSTFKKTNEKISKLGFGLMRLPVTGQGDANIDYAAAKQMLDTAFKNGVNYFDTAYGYHSEQSQLFAQKALAEYPRESYNLATKLPMWLVESKADAKRLFEEQLEKCGVEYFDFYLFHALNASSFEKVVKFGLWDLMREYCEQGKIKNLGFSFHDSAEVLEDICAKYSWDFAQIQLNYLDARQSDAMQQYEVLEKHNIPCIIMEPVRGGTLANLGSEANALLQKAAPQKSIASWAIRWAAGLPNVLTVLSGMSTMQQMEDNISTLSPLNNLSEAEQQTLQTALDIFTKNALIPCTACRYCMPCPAGLDIPALFGLYNKCAFDSWTQTYKERYAATGGKNGGDCVACRKCEEMCPQKIEISERMKQVHKKAVE